MAADLSNNTVFFETDASNVSGTDPSWSEGMLPSKVNDSARALQGALKRFYDHVNATVVSGGSANAQTLTYTVAPTAYVTGDRYTFIVGNGLVNTGPTTLNVNGLGAKNIFISGAYPLAGQELRTGQAIDVVYDGVQFQLLRGIVPLTAGFTPADPTGVVGAAVMMGIGSTCSITPKVSGEVLVSLTGDLGTGTTAAAGPIRVQLQIGTGTAPTNGAAVSGAAIGSSINFTFTNYTSGDRVPFTCLARASGLTLGTAYWIDISLSSASGTVTAKNLSMIVSENPR